MLALQSVCAAGRRTHEYVARPKGPAVSAVTRLPVGVQRQVSKQHAGPLRTSLTCRSGDQGRDGYEGHDAEQARKVALRKGGVWVPGCGNRATPGARTMRRKYRPTPTPMDPS